MAVSFQVDTSSGVRDDVFRILVLCRSELQQLNLNRIFSELEQQNIVSKGITNVMLPKTASQKSNVLVQLLQSRGVQDFHTFLKVCTTEIDPKFKEPTREFLLMVS